jgi:hypothetical protein
MIVYWTNETGGAFGTPANWSTGRVPGALDQARISASGTYTVTTVDGTVLSLSTVFGAAFDITGSFEMIEGTGSGVNRGSINIRDKGELTAGGDLDNAGEINLQSTGDSTQLLTAPDASLSLSGGGLVSLFGDSNVEITNNVNNEISGAGTVSLSNNERSGLIVATGPLAINSSGQTLINEGILEASSDGTLTLNGTINNSSSGGLIEANSSSTEDPTVVLNNVTLIGGTLSGNGDFVGTDLTNNTLDGLTAAVTNASNVALDFATLALEGTINNTGTIELFGGNTVLAINAAGATLEGGGTITLDNAINIENEEPFLVSISSNAASAKLTNVNNIISGDGNIGNSGSNTMTLVNQSKGVIDANEGAGAYPLVIDTGTNAVVNRGTLEATGTGNELYIASSVTNSLGNLTANEGEVVAAGAVAGGVAIIEGAGTVEFGAASTANTRFAVASTGKLVLDDAVQYTGTVVGFGANTTQSIDLPNVQFATLSKSYLEASPNTSGTLTVKDTAGDIAHIKLSGTYTLANFTFVDDGNGGTLITDPPVDQKNHTVASGATLTLTTAATGTETFAGKSGTLVLDDPTRFSGKILGFSGQDLIDLANIGFGSNTTLGYAANGSDSGKLTVSDGIHTANIALLGNYMASTFVTASDGHGGTLITEAPHAQQGLLTTPLT